MSTQPEAFDPAADAGQFRAALGAFATGVTVVTTQTDDGPVAIVANSFASVSLDPPLVLWSPAKSSKRFEDFAKAESYCIHILSQDHEDICRKIIADKAAIADVAMVQTACGLPVIAGAMAAFDCRLHAVHDAGDHAIIVGRVEKAHAAPKGDPMVFHAGRYRQFVPVA